MPAQVYLLIAPGVNENFLKQCLAQVRLMGIRVSCVGTRGEEVGVCGPSTYPDLSLDEIETASLPAQIILPGAVRCAQILSTDPRVGRLVTKMLAAGRVVGVAKGAEIFFSKKVRQNPKNNPLIVYQENRTSQAFIAKLCA